MYFKYLAASLAVFLWVFIIVQIGYNVGFWKTHFVSYFPHDVDMIDHDKLPSGVLKEELKKVIK